MMPSSQKSLGRGRGQRGFSLVELVMVVVIIMIVSSFAVIQIGSTMRNARVETAYQTTVMQLRRARQEAIDRRRIHLVSFTLPRTIRIQRCELGTCIPTTMACPDPLPAPPAPACLAQVSQLDLPTDIQFQLPEVGTSGTPDNMGVAAAVEFGSGQQMVNLLPDGSAAHVTTGAFVSGIVYLARPGEPSSTRAATLLGATGRVKGYRLVNQGGSWVWK